MPVFDILENLLRARGFAETHLGVTLAAFQPSTLDNAHLVAGVVVHQQRAARVEAIEPDRARSVIEDLGPPPARVRFFGTEGELDRAAFVVDGPGADIERKLTRELLGRRFRVAICSGRGRQRAPLPG